MSTDPISPSRPSLSALAICSMPAAIVLDSVVALFDGWRPQGQIEHGLLFLFALWLALGLLFLIHPFRHRLGLLWRELLLLAVVTSMGWLGLEIGAHLIEQSARPVTPLHTRGANVRNLHHPDPTHIVGITDPSHFTTGPDGVRAPAPPRPEQTTRVLCIGGSTTECVYLDDAETWPALLEQQASKLLATDTLWVGNVGISGFYTQDHIEFIKNSPLMKSTSVLVVQPGINDLWRFLAKEEDHTDFARFKTAATPPPAEITPARSIYRPRWTRSRVIQLYHTLRTEPPPPETQEGIGGPEYRIRRERRASAARTDQLPDLSVGLAAYRSRIQTIIDYCQDREIPVLFTTQPVMWRDALPPGIASRCWFGWLDDGRYLTLGALRIAMDQYNAALTEVCRDADIPCVDLSPLNDEAAYFYDDCHFTETGAAEVARRVAPALAEVVGR